MSEPRFNCSLPPTRLSDREVEVMDLVVEGMQNKEIAEELGMAGRTVTNHMAHIFEKMHIHNRTEAAVAYAMGGLDYYV